MTKSICFHFTVTGIPADKRLAFLAMVNAIAEYLDCNVAGNASDFILDTKQDEYILGCSIAACLSKGIRAGSMGLVLIEWQEANRE